MALGQNPIVEALRQLNMQKRQRRLEEDERLGRKDTQSQQGIANLLSLMRAAGGSGSPAGRDFGARAGSEMGLGPLSPDYFKPDTEQVDPETEQAKAEAELMAKATKLVALYNNTIDRDPLTKEVTIKPGMEGINKLVGTILQQLVGGANKRNVIAEDKRSPDKRSPIDVSLGAAGGMRSLPSVQAPSPARIGPPSGSAGPAQYGHELMGMYELLLGGPKQPTPEELRAENTREAYEKGKELGYWK